MINPISYAQFLSNSYNLNVSLTKDEKLLRALVACYDLLRDFELGGAENPELDLVRDALEECAK